MKYGSAGILLLAVVACSTIHEEMPTNPTNPTSVPAPAPAPQPVVVVPVPVPVPTTGPPTNPAPNPGPTNPNPNPNPNPPPSNGNGGGGGGNVASVTAGVHSYLRNGHLVPTGGTEFKVGDVVYLNCTPRDADGNPANSHGPLQAWFISGDAGYVVTDTDTFNPDLHTSAPPGHVNIACRVNDITSPTKRLTISN
jgi:hypothetical protein